ncbi:CCAAT/enhancer-binding protein delta [Sceloporus undulatus]|uniref:CCAAT/enhancer-binding protein delta n=1 Tax=Sceloporus undulatus TaxID=8520 RepID=UPI001C4C39D8|nr:CCAAT/enhancer-binding protein delta [Sceloporus undulatus]
MSCSSFSASAALASLDALEPSLPCFRTWSLEPANFYEAPGLESAAGLSPSCKAVAAAAVEDGAGVGLSSSSSTPASNSSGSRDLAELSAAAPSMYEEESAIDFSAYIDSMAAAAGSASGPGVSSVPTLELCHDELFLDLFNSSHKGGLGEYLELPPPPSSSSLASLLHSGFPPRSSTSAVKQEPDWEEEEEEASLLPSQIAACAQTVVSLPGQPTPPASPEPLQGSASPSSCSSRSSSSSSSSSSSLAGKAPRPSASSSSGKKCLDRFSPEYRQRRERNNIAVRKSRDKAKRRNQEMQQKLVELSSENERLHKKVEQLSRDLGHLRHYFKQVPPGAFLPGALPAPGR